MVPSSGMNFSELACGECFCPWGPEVVAAVTFVRLPSFVTITAHLGQHFYDTQVSLEGVQDDNRVFTSAQNEMVLISLEMIPCVGL